MQESHYAVTVPACSRRWESKTLLLGTQQQTGRVEIPFRRPVTLLAARPTLVVLAPIADVATPTLYRPTLDDIEVYLDISEKTRLTSRFDLTRVANSEAGQFVALASYSDTIFGASVLHLKLNDPSPVIGTNFKWVRDVTGGPFYYDVIVGLTLYALYEQDVNGV